MAGPDAYAQWVQMNISNYAKDTLDIENAKLDWGKFYRDGNKGVEIKPQALDGTTIEDDQTVPVYSCGRDGAASGTEGSFELHDQKTQKRVCTIEWDCPWGSHTNTFDIKNINDQFRVVHGPYNKSGGALGTVDISVNPAGHGHH